MQQLIELKMAQKTAAELLNPPRMILILGEGYRFMGFFRKRKKERIRRQVLEDRLERS